MSVFGDEMSEMGQLRIARSPRTQFSKISNRARPFDLDEGELEPHLSVRPFPTLVQPARGPQFPHPDLDEIRVRADQNRVLWPHEDSFNFPGLSGNIFEGDGLFGLGLIAVGATIAFFSWEKSQVGVVIGGALIGRGLHSVVKQARK